jgi:hypothetical protein
MKRNIFNLVLMMNSDGLADDVSVYMVQKGQADDT